MPNSHPTASRSAMELARAAAQRAPAERRTGVTPLEALDTASRLARGEPPTAPDAARDFYEHLLSTEGLTALDALRDAGEALQSAVKLSDLKKRSMLAHLAREGADVDIAPQTMLQGSYAHGSLVRPLPDARIDAAPVASAETLGGLIRRAREERGLSQHKLAEQAGVGRRFVSELENGKSSLEFDKVLQVARAAGVSLIARAQP